MTKERMPFLARRKGIYPIMTTKGAKSMEKDELIYQFHDTGLLTTAMTHSSYANEHGKAGIHYERLEFLGDAVL